MRPPSLPQPRYGRFADALLSYAPTALLLDNRQTTISDVSGRGWHGTITGTPIRGVPFAGERGTTWSGSGQFATTSTSIPNPTAAISVVTVFRTTDAGAAARSMFARGATNQFSWDLRIGSTHLPTFVAYQSNAATHCAASTAVAANDGLLNVVAGTFDGTTLRVYRISQSGIVNTNSSTSLTNSWHITSTAGVQMAGISGGSQLFPGLVGPSAVYNDKILTNNDIRYLAWTLFS